MQGLHNQALTSVTLPVAPCDLNTQFKIDTVTRRFTHQSSTLPPVLCVTNSGKLHINIFFRFFSSCFSFQIHSDGEVGGDEGGDEGGSKGGCKGSHATHSQSPRLGPAIGGEWQCALQCALQW